jgi:hypothetical protein
MGQDAAGLWVFAEKDTWGKGEERELASFALSWLIHCYLFCRRLFLCCDIRWQTLRATRVIGLLAVLD